VEEASKKKSAKNLALDTDWNIGGIKKNEEN
jgi:hypothetical protein